jgi:putative hemolysin
MGTQFIILGILLILSACFSAIETAFTSLTRVRLQYMLKNKGAKAKIVAKLKEDMPKLLTTVLIGNNLVNIGASALATIITLRLFEHHSIPYAEPVAVTTGVMTLIVLIFSEITPKTIAQKHAEAFALFFAYPLKIFMIIIFPILIPLTHFARLVSSLSGPQKKHRIRDDLSLLAGIGTKQGEIMHSEKEMMEGIFEMQEAIAKQVMIPRSRIYALNAKKKVSEALTEVVDQNYSRIPVYENSIDHIVGIVYLKDILKHVVEGKLDTILYDMMEPAYVVPDVITLDRLLSEFRRRRIHLAIVVDEHGLVVGIVTIEDILEEIVGDIFDETDEVEHGIRQIGRNRWAVDGSLDIDDAAKSLSLDIEDEKNGYGTISGLVMHKFGKVPDIGDSVNVGNTTFVVQEKEKHRITRLMAVSRK